MRPDAQVCCDLLELMEMQEAVIVKQSEVIARLTQASMERENLINALAQAGEQEGA